MRILKMLFTGSRLFERAPSRQLQKATVIKLHADNPYPCMFRNIHDDGPKSDGEQKRPERFAPNAFEAKKNRRR